MNLEDAAKIVLFKSVDVFKELKEVLSKMRKYYSKAAFYFYVSQKKGKIVGN